MIIKAVLVQNFRSILDETLYCEELTALVGRNGTGKSSFLRAIELFYAVNPRCSIADFHAEDASQPIEITITFIDLSPEETERFSSYLENGELTVVRVLAMVNDKVQAKYHGSALQNPRFAEVRNAPNAREVTARYNQLRQSPEYADLPAVRAREQALDALRAWETAHQDQCIRQRDDGQFFGFTEVAQGYLGQYTRFISIPAVRDASEDASEGKGSPITELMDLVVRSVLVNRQEVVELRREVQEKYRQVMDPTHLTEMNSLAQELTSTLKAYVPDAGVALKWDAAEGVDIPLPKAEVRLVEDDYGSTVIRAGHGLQRAFILTLLQHLTIARIPPARNAEAQEMLSEGQAQSDAIRRMPNLILGIEEPELYQHPNRQRHFAKVLLRLATGAIAGVAQKTQVIYSTHSPLCVGLDRFNQIRLLRKVQGEANRPKVTRCVQTSLDTVAGALWEASDQTGEAYTAATLLARLQAIMTPWMNEGFFADVVVLVEGEEDRAAILGTAIAMGYDLESLGISVIPCGGKRSLDRPLVVFQKFEISTYVIWDSDQGVPKALPEENRYLLRLLEQTEEDWPSVVTDQFACFQRNLGTTLREAIGDELYDRLAQQVQTELGISERDQALKNPVFVQKLLEASRIAGKTCSTLEHIVQRILGLRPTDTHETRDETRGAPARATEPGVGFSKRQRNSDAEDFCGGRA